jgi:uncharacterized membrane-anchored protein YitT (DUF2179 family)
MFLVNLPFYAFGLAALGKRFTFKTFCAVGTLSLPPSSSPASCTSIASTRSLPR